MCVSVVVATQCFVWIYEMNSKYCIHGNFMDDKLKLYTFIHMHNCRQFTLSSITAPVLFNVNERKQANRTLISIYFDFSSFLEKLNEDENVYVTYGAIEVRE